VRTHRRGIPKSAFEQIPDRMLANARRSAALLRLAVLLHRSHDNDRMPALPLRAEGGVLKLTLDKRWLQSRPLLRADLDGEPEDMLGLGVQLRLAIE
jgi:exopolyphosphatase/guanosine-5'-triphosphate,3'-diphosphate pyrophosphatase